MSNWITDAQFAEDIDEKSLLVSNQRIENFLLPKSYNQFIIVASKGMGKTLLLRHKRKLIEQENPSILLIPHDETSDYVSLPASLGQELTNVLDDSIFWEDLWKLSIAVSVLLHFPHRISSEERLAIDKELARAELPQQILEEIRSAFAETHVVQRRPSSILDQLLRMKRGSIEKLRKSGLQTVWNIFNKYVSSACFVFIDSFDQALNRLYADNLAIWCSAQCGLLKAAWELSRHNRHVKVYVTIRQEAYSYFDDPERINIRGNVLLLEYSKEDLHAIFEKAVQYYERVSSIDSFVGFGTIYNGYLRVHEKIFDYIHRHTIGIPRWFMAIGAEISNSRKARQIIRPTNLRSLQQKKVAEIVNRVSSELALDYIKNEMKLFFGTQQPELFIEKIVGRVNSSVLSQANIGRIAEKVTSEPDWAGTKHPFCLLFNLGLLGYVARTAENTHRKQTFKKPYQFDWDYEHILPQDPDTYYLIHPCLHHLIQNKNFKFKYNKVRLGDGILWTSKEDERVESEKIKIFISYAHLNAAVVESIADTIDQYLSVKAVIHDVWFDQWKLKAGKWFQDQMSLGLRNSDFLILIVSKDSLGSHAVSVEWKTKFGEKISKNTDCVLPFIIDDTKFDELDTFLGNIYSYRYDGDAGKINRLCEDIIYLKEQQLEKKAARK